MVSRSGSNNRQYVILLNIARINPKKIRDSKPSLPLATCKYENYWKIQILPMPVSFTCQVFTKFVTSVLLNFGSLPNV